MAQLMPLLLAVCCCSKIQIGFTFLVPAHLGSFEKRAVKRVCVCIYHSVAMASCSHVYHFTSHLFAACCAVNICLCVVHFYIHSQLFTQQVYLAGGQRIC